MRNNGFLPLLIQMRKTERSVGIIPCKEMGGKGGVTAVMNMSFDLANESHFDANDLGSGISIWAERQPGTACNWNLMFTNMTITHEGRAYKGLKIELCHGAVVQWDGRVMKHCTSMTKINGENVEAEVSEEGDDACNRVYGCFFAPSGKLVSQAVGGVGGVHPYRRIPKEYRKQGSSDNTP
jgi:hypothetical protein